MPSKWPLSPVGSVEWRSPRGGEVLCLRRVAESCGPTECRRLPSF